MGTAQVMSQAANESDPSLLRRLQANEHRAQETVRKELLPIVKAICLQILQDQALAESTAEDVLTDFLFDYVHKLRDERAIRKYIRMMAVRRSVRIRDWQRRYLEPTDLAANGPGPEEAAISEFDRSRQSAQLAACLASLKPRARELLRLRFFHDMTFEAIGESIGTSKQYVSRTVLVTLKALKKCIERKNG